MKELNWNVKQHSFNSNEISNYDVLNDCLIANIKKWKKECNNKAEFSEKMRSECMWRYWSKCEWELVIKKVDDRIILLPWVGRKEPTALDVTDDTSFDWAGFADKHIKSQIYKDEAKIDVYDQLAYRWNEFIDYCWYTRLKYERYNPKFDRE